MSAAVVGLFGKLPARGDFVRAALPGSFVTPWDAWLQGAMAGSQHLLGDAWLPAWLEAPVWRFALGQGVCGAASVLGLMLPSVDRVGRYFPLTLAAVLPPGRSAPSAEAGATWLDACELAGRGALERDAAPEEVVRMLPVLTEDGGISAGSLWWTDGGPRVPAGRRTLDGLPPVGVFATMLDDRRPPETDGQ